MGSERMSPVKILIIPGSLRSGSHNVRLAGAAMAELVEAGADVSLISLADFPLPIYDGDLEATSGVPAKTSRIARFFRSGQRPSLPARRIARA